MSEEAKKQADTKEQKASVTDEDVKKALKNELSDDFQKLLGNHRAKIDETLDSYGSRLEEIGESTKKISDLQATIEKLSGSLGTVEKLKETFESKEEKEARKKLRESISDDDYYVKDKVLDTVEDRILQEKQDLISAYQELAEQLKELKANSNGGSLTKEQLITLMKEDAELKEALSPFIEEKGKAVTRQVMDDDRFYSEVEKLEEAGIPKDVQQTVVNHFDAMLKSGDKEKVDRAKKLKSISEMVDAYAQTDEGKWVKNLFQKEEDSEKDFTVQRLLNRHQVPKDPGVGAEDFAERKTDIQKASDALKIMMQHSGSKSDSLLRN